MSESTSPMQQQPGIRCAITVPREIVNADNVFVVRWSIDDGQPVKSGDVVCEIETSKAAVGIEACESGFLRHRAAVGEPVPIGGTLGYVTVDAKTTLPQAAPEQAAGAAEPNISAKARKKIEALGLDIALFRGMGLVREQDVLAVAQKQEQAAPQPDARGAFRAEPLGPVQRRVAHAMEQSLGVPVSYLERHVNLEPVAARVRDLMAESKAMISVVDLLVGAVARAAAQYNRFNAWYVSETELRLFEQVNVGVAVDVENDLYVVVVRDAHVKDAPTLSAALRKLQYLAQRRRLELEHLTGGTITVTSLLGRGIRGFQPLLFPQQSAIVGISDGDVPGTARLTLGFDHRVANGGHGAAFLAVVEHELLG